ncbi:hypothetical protein C8J56DRAFT_280864 [Mycena floridula]|nr:hypothetical protein C8J56DRAFT_280864 [Mycena floridula]
MRDWIISTIWLFFQCVWAVVLAAPPIVMCLLLCLHPAGFLAVNQEVLLFLALFTLSLITTALSIRWKLFPDLIVETCAVFCTVTSLEILFAIIRHPAVMLLVPLTLQPIMIWLQIIKLLVGRVNVPRGPYFCAVLMAPDFFSKFMKELPAILRMIGSMEESQQIPETYLRSIQRSLPKPEEAPPPYSRY